MAAFKVMTWIVENLFRPPANVADPEKQSYQEKLALLAGVINQLDPDVLALRDNRRWSVMDSHVDFVIQHPSVGANPGDRAGEVAPDHAPVTAAFDL
jgi:hypothetical protein